MLRVLLVVCLAAPASAIEPVVGELSAEPGLELGTGASPGSEGDVRLGVSALAGAEIVRRLERASLVGAALAEGRLGEGIACAVAVATIVREEATEEVRLHLAPLASGGTLVLALTSAQELAAPAARAIARGVKVPVQLDPAPLALEPLHDVRARAREERLAARADVGDTDVGLAELLAPHALISPAREQAWCPRTTPDASRRDPALRSPPFCRGSASIHPRQRAGERGSSSIHARRNPGERGFDLDPPPPECWRVRIDLDPAPARILASGDRP